jgi:Zn-dependent metalloprotease
MIKFFIALLTTLNLNASSFKEQRTNKISPLADTIISIEKQKQATSQKTISTMSIRKNKFKAFNETNSKKKNWSIRMSSYGIPKLLSGDRTKRYYGTPEEIFNTFITENKDMLGIDINNLKLTTQSQFLNTKHLYYQQYYKNIPVEFSYVKLHLTDNNEVTQYNAKYYPDIDIDINPKTTMEQARFAISSELGSFSVSTSTLVVYPDELNNRYYLAWKIEINGGNGSMNGNWVYYINSDNNSILFKYDKRQYSCTYQEETNGTVRGMVYDISPVPTGIDNGPDSWVTKISTPISNQYVFAGGVNESAGIVMKSTSTDNNGEYCIDYGDSGAKISMTTMGPYFSVMNFNGIPSYYTNGTGIWKTQNINDAITYNNNIDRIYPNDYSIKNDTLVFVGPVFSKLNVGDADLNDDMLYVMDSTPLPVSAWFGVKNNFIGGLASGNSYKIRVKSDSSITGDFTISKSSYLVISNPIGNDNSRGSITWSTNSYLTDGNGVTINTFYHLNKIRNFMMKFNSKCSKNNEDKGCIDLNKRVPVITSVDTDEWIQNAFYDLNHDAIFYGKGIDMGYYYKDFGLDGTVVRHEYGHLVMNRIYPIIYFGEFGAISEAISDYFSLSSFWDEGKDITVLGNFIDTGVGTTEGTIRDLSTITNKMPDDWAGEVHEDGKILSGALYKIRKGSYALESFTSGPYNGLDKADLYIFGALFYFPDNFENFLEALVDTCNQIYKQINDGICPSVEEDKIRNAFEQHGIGSHPALDIHEPNNGPEYATDISTFNTIQAYIDYIGDEDYYALTLNEGLFHARLYLPESQEYTGFYHAYNMFLFDSYRKYVTDISPSCYEKDDHCYTRKNYVDLYYSVTEPQIYYIAITGYGNDRDYNAITPYILSYDSDLRSSVLAKLLSSKFDEDEIEFSVKVPKFEYLKDLTHNWDPGSEFEFCGLGCIKILDNNLNELSTNYITVTPSDGSSYNSYDTTGNPVIKGKIKFQSYAGKTFSQRYPAVGTIYLKLYANNHMSGITEDTFNLGTSNPINLTANSNSFISYNNIINSNNATMTLKYETKEASNIKIYVYTATGQLVKKIYEGQGYGKMSFSWDGTDDSGKKLSSGIYYIKTEGAVNKVEKVAIVR